MAHGLYDTTVASFVQTLGAVSGFMQKGLDHCTKNGIDPKEIVENRIHADMLPFSFQILSVTHHSRGAIASAKSGIFRPPGKVEDWSYGDLQKMVSDAEASLKGENRDEIDALVGRDVTFELNEKFKLPFTVEGFLASFSTPNFYFHATTAYAILRGKGVPLGKRDFLGAMRMKA